MSQFTFLQAEFPAIYGSANKAFSAVHPDPRTACFYTRRALELTVNWLYKHDNSLELPYQDNLSALIHEPTFKTLVGVAAFNKRLLIIKLGNQAVHSARPISVNDAINSKTKFWQMVGRGTRRCPDLFGLGQDKQFFYLFDYCQNLEFFRHNPDTTDAPIGKSLGKQLFTTRLELITELDKKHTRGYSVSLTLNRYMDGCSMNNYTKGIFMKPLIPSMYYTTKRDRT